MALGGKAPRGRRARPGLILVAVILSTPGCAPSLTDLVQDRHYDEALCATAQRRGTPSADRDFVTRALARDAAPSLHVYAVTAQDLRAAVGPKGDRLHRELVILRSLVDVNRVTGVDFRFDLGLHDGKAFLKQLPLDRAVLASRVGERLPPTRVVRTRRGGIRLRKVDVWLLFAGLAEGLTLGIVPVTQMTGHVQRVSPIYRTVPPKDAEFARSAPAAETLYRSLAAKPRAVGATEPPAQEVSLWQRPAPAARVNLHIQWRYEVWCRGNQVRLDQRLILPLPPGPTLEARVNALFGGRMRRLSALQALAHGAGASAAGGTTK